MWHTYYPQDGQWSTVEEALNVHTIDELTLLATLLPGGGVGGRKAQRIAAFCRALKGKSLKGLFSRLSELEQAVVAQAVHAPDARFNPMGFEIRHGEAADFGRKGTHGIAEPSLLCLFIYGKHIPLDLRARLEKLVPAPAERPVPTVEEIAAKIEVVVPPYGAGNPRDKTVRRKLPVYRSDGEIRAVAELAGVLRLIEAGQIQVTPKTRQVAAKSRRQISEVLEDGDFFAQGQRPRWSRSGSRVVEDDAPIRAFAWPGLLTNGGLARPVKGRLRLTAAGKKALRSPPADTLRTLWQDWQRDADFDELRRISEVKGVSTLGYDLSDPRVRRARIADALACCPPGEWIEVDAFFDHLRAGGYDFQITGEPWRLYMEDYPKQPLDGWDEPRLWLILQARYILCVLFEVMATLGMLDVAYTTPTHAREDTAEVSDLDSISRYDGLRYFRLTPLGLYCLGLAATYAAEVPDVSGSLRVQTDLTIVAATELPRSTRLVLDLYAERASDTAWHLERSRLLAAIEAKNSVARFREFLADHVAGPLPESALEFLRDCEERGRCLKLTGAGKIVECPDAALAAKVAGDSRTRKHCMLAGERHLVVPARSEGAFRRALQKLGYGWPGEGD